MKTTKSFRIFTFLLMMSYAWDTFGSVATIDSIGRTKRWGNPYLQFFTNYLNGNGLSYSQVFTSFTNSLSYWKYGGTTTVDFDYWQGTSNVTPMVSYDGRNTVFFLTRSSMNLGSGVIAVTYMYSSGATILETDLVFNDRDFIFTTNPAHTTNLTGNASVFLETVATHEFGHSYGLGHSAHLQSSMMWQEARGQSKPSCDDHTGLSQLYPNTNFTAQTGSISGAVVAQDGVTAVFGAHVQAISKRRGTVEGAAISGSNGSFSISSLEPDDYILSVEPFVNLISSLCGGSSSGCYYANVNYSTACGGASIKRGFVQQAAGYPAFYSVAQGQNTPTGTVVAPCSALQHFHAGTGSISVNTPTMMPANGSADKGSVFGVFSGTAGTDAHYYKLQNVSGSISVKALSFSLYSKANVTVQFVDTVGNVLGSSRADVFPNAVVNGVYVNHDSSASITLGSAGDVYVKVSYASNLSSGVSSEGYVNLFKYPGPSAVDTQAFYVLLSSANDFSSSVLDPSAAPYLTENARCEKNYSFAAYADRGDPGANTASASLASSSGGGTTITKRAGGCGSIIAAERLHAQSRGRGPAGKGSGGPSVFSTVLSSWGALILLYLSWLAIRLKRRYT